MLTSWPGHDAAAGVDEAQRAVLGHEDVLDDDVVAAGAAQADGVPDVLDLVVGPRQQERPEVDRRALVADDQAAEEDPLGVVAAGGEAPPAAEREAAVDGLGPAHRCVGRGDQRGRVLAPHLLLGPVVVERRAATGARRAPRTPSRSSRRRSRSAGRRGRSRPARPRGRRSARGCSSRKKPVSCSDLMFSSGMRRRSSVSWARSRSVGSSSGTASRTPSARELAHRFLPNVGAVAEASSRQD